MYNRCVHLAPVYLTSLNMRAGPDVGPASFLAIGDGSGLLSSRSGSVVDNALPQNNDAPSEADDGLVVQRFLRLQVMSKFITGVDAMIAFANQASSFSITIRPDVGSIVPERKKRNAKNTTGAT